MKPIVFADAWLKDDVRGFVVAMAIKSDGASVQVRTMIRVRATWAGWRIDIWLTNSVWLNNR